MSGETVAYLIMETASDPVKPTNIREVKTGNGLFYLQFDTVLQAFNRKNRNGRTYEAAAMQLSLFQAEHLAELMEKKSWFGEAGHPMEGDVKRILTIDPLKISHKISKIWMTGSEILNGRVETLDDGGGPGSRFTRLILQGMEPAFSLRALAPVTKYKDGSAAVRSKAHIVCYDWVILPSHKEAYRDQSKPIDQITKKIGDNTIAESSLAIPVSESALKDYIMMESTNVRAVSNIFDVALETMQISPDFKHAIVKEGANTVVINIDEKIKREVRSFMSRL